MIINTQEEFDRVLNELKSAKIIAFDFETLPSGKYPEIDDKSASLHHKTSKIEGLAVRSETMSPVYIPFIDTEISRINLYAGIKEMFQQDSLFTAHNLQFDAKIADYFFGARPKNKFCTMVGYWYLDENSLKSKVVLGRELFGMETIPYNEAKKLEGKAFEDYVLRDAEFAYQLYLYEKEKLEELGFYELVSNLEMDFVDVLIDMNLYGTTTDIDYLKKGVEILTNKSLELEALIYKKYGEFNVKSTNQLCEKVYGAKITRKGGKVKIDWQEGNYPKPVKWTKPKDPANKVPSTDDKTLDRINTPVARNIQEFRKTAKCLDTYAIGYQKWIIEGKIWPSFNHVGTVTGRLSSDRPNMQNLPKAPIHGWWIREAIHAQEGYDLIVADESQLEIRILAHLSKDENLTAAIISGEDIHLYVARLLFGKEDISKEDRYAAKTLNFAIIYGMSEFELAGNLRVTEEKATALMATYFKTFPSIQRYVDRCAKKMFTDGYVKSLLGRHRTIKEIYADTNSGKYKRAVRQTVNSIIQGSASDILKVAMIKINKEFKERNLDAHILLQIHDELVIEVKKEHTEEATKIVKKYMELPFAEPLRVPLLVEPVVCHKWSEGK